VTLKNAFFKILRAFHASVVKELGTGGYEFQDWPSLGDWASLKGGWASRLDPTYELRGAATKNP
jgi:hypothetical protein